MLKGERGGARRKERLQKKKIAGKVSFSYKKGESSSAGQIPPKTRFVLFQGRGVLVGGKQNLNKMCLSMRVQNSQGKERRGDNREAELPRERK